MIRLLMLHSLCPNSTAKIRVSRDSPQHEVPAQSLPTEPGPNCPPFWEEIGSLAIRTLVPSLSLSHNIRRGSLQWVFE